MQSVIILYIPVIHNGYLEFFRKYHDVDCLYIPSDELIDEFTPFKREIRQISAIVMKDIIESGKLFQRVEILNHSSISKIQNCQIITASDSVSSGIVGKYFPHSNPVIDTVFLRWDEKNVRSEKPAGYDEISTDPFDREMIEIAGNEAVKGSCWWRRVGAVLVKDRKIMLIKHNIHVPSEHSPYAIGDPRDFIEAGKDNEIATTLHAEEMIVVEAARRNDLGLEGTSIYPIVFPCPKCAKMIAYSGIKKCYFKEGHASLDGLESMKAKKVKIILVK